MSQSVRFEPEDPGHRIRVSAGAPLLMGFGSIVLSALGRIRAEDALHRGERVWGRMVERLVDCRIRVRGLERIQQDRPYVVAPLHEGFADVLALLRLPLPLRWVVRDELAEWPELGRYLRSTRQVVAPDGRSRTDLRRFLRRAERVIGQGTSLVLFPQGSVLGIEVAFRPGVRRIARHLDVPVLPVVLAGSHRVWHHPFSPIVRMGQTIDMEVMPPVDAGDLDQASWRRLERSMKHRALDSLDAPVRRYVPVRDGWWDGYDFDVDDDYPDVADAVRDHRGLGVRR